MRLRTRLCAVERRLRDRVMEPHDVVDVATLSIDEARAVLVRRLSESKPGQKRWHPRATALLTFPTEPQTARALLDRKGLLPDGR